MEEEELGGKDQLSCKGAGGVASKNVCFVCWKALLG